MIRLGDAKEFHHRLHGGLSGYVALLVKAEGRKASTHYSRAGRLPKLPQWTHYDPVTLALSVCTFQGRRRRASAASEVPALWAEVDPPTIEPPALDSWRTATIVLLRSFDLAPSMVVDSGRGFHVYLLLEEPIRLEGSETLAAQVQACNRALAEQLSTAGLAGDAVGDLARVLRLPGSNNPKPGGGPCRLLLDDGPRYSFEDLLAATYHPQPRVVSAPTPRSMPTQRGSSSPVASRLPRRPGRPSLGITKHDLRRLRSSARDLVVGGPWRSGSKYKRPDGRGIDRSRADLAAVGYLVRAGFSNAAIFAAFERSDWLIGNRYRELGLREGADRARNYLQITIEKARRCGGSA